MSVQTRLRGDKDSRVILPDLHPGQKFLYGNRRKKNWVCAGRGWRKSSLAVDLAVLAAKEGANVHYSAFTFGPIKKLHDELWRPVVFGKENWERFYNATDHVLRFEDWGVIQFASLVEAETSRGGSPDLMIVDEAGEVEDWVWESIILPMRDKLNCELWVFGTPNPFNPKNEFYRKLKLDTTLRQNADTMSAIIPVFGAEVIGDELVRRPSPYELPFYGEATEEEGWDKMWMGWMQTSASGRIKWRIERLCHFLKDEGSVIEDPEKVCNLETVSGDFISELFLKDHRIDRAGGWYKAGVDFGLSNDYTVISIMCRHTNRQVYFRRFVPNSHTTEGRFEQIYVALKRAYDLFGGVWDIDANGIGAGIAGVMGQRFGIYLRPNVWRGTTKPKEEMSDHLAYLIEGNRIALFKEQVIIDELDAVQQKRTSTGRKIAAPEGTHDDIFNSLMLMVKGVQGGVVREVKEPPKTLKEIYNSGRRQYRNPFATVEMW